MIKQIVLEVTSGCNLDCVYCYNVWKSPRSSYPRGQLSLHEWVRLIDRLADELPLEWVAISGGEPFLRQDLPQLVAHLWARQLRIVMITNGTLLTQERIEQTPGITNYELPLLSYRREVHDRLTRREAFDSVIQGALNLRRQGEAVVFAFVATRLNCGDLARTLDLAVALGGQGLMYNRMNVSAHNLPHARELLPTPDMLRENLELLDDFSGRFHFPVSASIPVPPCVLDTRRYKNVVVGMCPLGGDDSYFTVDPLGNLRVCNHSSVILGNLLEASFSELVRRPYMGRFTTQMPPSCRPCPAEVRDRCQGGCKCAAEECYGSFEIEEPFLAWNQDRRTLPHPAS